MQRKLILVVLDSVGVGALPDAGEYGDAGTNTLAHIAQKAGGLHLPHLAGLGLGNVVEILGVPKVETASGCFGKMAEASKGKDSTTGHWEIAGVVTNQAFPLYPKGFPDELVQVFLRESGCRGILGNRPASGTEIIKELGDAHVRTGFPIVYTSGDSVFQIAAHEEIIPLDRLYEICRKARESVLVGEHRVGRVIARPFVGTTGHYVRTPFRRDYAVEPPENTVLDLLHDLGVRTSGIGKIDDLFCGRGLQEKIHTKSNAEGIEKIIETAASMRSGFLMANLVDFDMLYGHRQDAAGYARALEEFDARLPEIQAQLAEGDLLMLTADHGNDPTDLSTDHTREYVPVICCSRNGKRNVDLGIRSTFADVGKTVLDFFSAGNQRLAGASFLADVQ